MRGLIWFVMASAVWAQAPMPLSLARAVEIALSPDGNVRVRIAGELIGQANTRAAQARSALLPNFDGSIVERNSVQNLRAMGIDFSVPIPGFHFPSVVGPFTVFDARVSGAQSVFDFASIRRLQAARTAVSAVKAEAQGTRQQVAEQVARAYLALARTDAAVETAKANLEMSESLLKLASNQKAAGTGTGIEIVRAEVQRANERQRFEVVSNERDRARLQLLRLMGLKLDGDLELTSKLAYRAYQPPALADAVKAAVDSRADVAAQRERERTAGLSSSATRWERLPSVAFFGDYGSIGNAPTSAIPTRTYGLSLRVPLYDGGRRDARRAESDSQVRVERLRSADLAQQIEMEVRLALDSLRSAEAQVATATEGFELANRELTQARRRYEAGVANGVEVTDAETRLQRARDNQIAALFNHNLARVDLAGAMGAIEQFVSAF